MCSDTLLSRSVADRLFQTAGVTQSSAARLTHLSIAIIVTHLVGGKITTDRVSLCDQWLNDGVAAASSDGPAPLMVGGPRQFCFILNQRGRALT